MTTMTDDAEVQSRSPTTAIAGYLRQTVSVSSILQQIWIGRWLVAGCFVLGLCYGVYTVWTSPARYMATIRVSPAESDISGGDAPGAVGLLADLTGGTNATRVPKFTQFTMGIGSVGVAELLDKRHDMVCRVYKNDCDLTTHTWRQRTGIRESINGFFAWLGHLPDPNGARTTIDLADYIRGQVQVDQAKQSAVATLSFTNTDRQFASEFLSRVVRGTNDYIKRNNHQIQKNYVEYLTIKAGQATNVEQRQAIDNLLLQSERQLMMTEVDVPYAAQIMDGPTVVPVYGVPKKLVLHALIGMLIGIAIALCRNFVPVRWRFW